MLFRLVSLMILLLSGLPLAAQEANLTDGCVEDYAADVDYFPHKAEIRDAENFSVEYFGHYKVVRVTDAFAGAPLFEYVLVQCGTPMPSAADFAPGTQFIEAPTGDVIILSTTQLPVLTQLDLLDNLVGLDSAAYINDDETLEMVAAGEVAEVGYGAAINIELVLSLEPQMVLSYGFDPATDAHPVLLDAGLFTAMDASWREFSPLGRAEWLKFIALFYNLEAKADARYDEIVSQYEAARELAAGIAPSERPTVLLNSYLGYANAWFIPGSDTYVGQLVRDAGGELLLSQADSTASEGLSFEVVYEGGLDADVWLVDTFAVDSLADLLALDGRFGDFAAFQSGDVWNNNRDQNANGGNNYYEAGVTNPHWVLQDMAAIFHPELLPDHEFKFYQQLANE